MIFPLFLGGGGGGRGGGVFLKKSNTLTTSSNPMPIPNPIDPPNPIPNPIDHLTLSLDLAPPVFFIIIIALTWIWTPNLWLWSPSSSPLCHTSNRCKFAHICWSNKLLVPDSPFPFDTNYRCNLVWKFQPSLKNMNQFKVKSPS